MVDLMYYCGPTKKNKSWVQDCTRGAMDLMYYHGPTQKNKTWVQDCTQGVMVLNGFKHGKLLLFFNFIDIPSKT